jgi:perosamine synthetase
LQFNAEPEYIYNSAWITSLVIDKKYGLDKNKLMDKLIAKDIAARPFFYPLSSIPAIIKAGYDTDLHKSKNPNSYDISSRGLNLPSPLNMTQEQIVFTCEAIKDILKERN